MAEQARRQTEVWESAAAYERYVGRWSRRVAEKFLDWLGLPAGLDWLDLGCGSGALSQAILSRSAPSRLTSLDRSAGFVAFTRANTPDERGSFLVADALALPLASESQDAVVSGFVLNFLPDLERAVREQARLLRPGGCLAAYVWDYAGKMEFMKIFWEAACQLEPAACELDEGLRFPVCNPGPLADLYSAVGIRQVAVEPIDIETLFRDFDDFWMPFLGGQGPAPTYLLSLDEERRAALRSRLYRRLPLAEDGSIPLTARAWAVRGMADS